MKEAMPAATFYGYVKQYLFITVEPVTAYASPAEMPEVSRLLWQRKAAILEPIHDPQDELSLYYQKAPFYAEFGKIAAIGLAYFVLSEAGELELRATGIAAREEQDLLMHFASTFTRKRFPPKEVILVGHHSKEFHIPMLGRRFLAHQLPLPLPLQMRNLKPWEVQVVDTLDLWRFTERKSYINLAALADALSLAESPPADELLILAESTSNQLAEAHCRKYHNLDAELKSLASMARYKAALTAKVMLRLNNLPDIAADAIKFV